MREIMAAAVLGAAVFLLAGPLRAETNPGTNSTIVAGEVKLQTECPVMGGKIDKKTFLDYQGKRIYFCCSGCLEEFRANPEKYTNELKSKGIELEDAPASGQ